MRVGVKTGTHAVSWEGLEDIWSYAQANDSIASLWTWDHLDMMDVKGGGSFEGWTAMTSLARLAPTKVVGVLVLANPLNSPALLAKMATVMDHASRGRFVLGLGSGSWPPEMSAFGISDASPEDRMTDLEHAVSVIKALLSAGTASTSLEAGPYRLREARNIPAPFRTGGPPIWIGAAGPRGLRLAARLADGWNFCCDDVDAFKVKRASLMQALADEGRPSSSMAVSAQLDLHRASDFESARVLATRFHQAGCDELIFSIDVREGVAGVRRMENEILKPLGDAGVPSTASE